MDPPWTCLCLFVTLFPAFPYHKFQLWVKEAALTFGSLGWGMQRGFSFQGRTWTTGQGYREAGEASPASFPQLLVWLLWSRGNKSKNQPGLFTVIFSLVSHRITHLCLLLPQYLLELLAELNTWIVSNNLLFTCFPKENLFYTSVWSFPCSIPINNRSNAILFSWKTMGCGIRSWPRFSPCHHVKVSYEDIWACEIFNYSCKIYQENPGKMHLSDLYLAVSCDKIF